MKNKITCIVILITNLSFSQNNVQKGWTQNEISQHQNLMALTNYVYKKQKSEIYKDILFNRYVFFDYVLNDTDIDRKNMRLAKFDTIFYTFRDKVNTLDKSNFEAKPIRFYKNHKIYEPFDDSNAKESISGEKMYPKSANVFAYYDKENPDNPLGVLLFEEQSNKLASWILINQGGYHYFLLFNLL